MQEPKVDVSVPFNANGAAQIVRQLMTSIRARTARDTTVARNARDTTVVSAPIQLPTDGELATVLAACYAGDNEPLLAKRCLEIVRFGSS